MSKYTVEIQYILKSGYPIFDFNYPFYDESKRMKFQERFIKHFYFREIGMETIDAFKLYLENKFNEVLPYYNELFRTASLDYDKLNKIVSRETYTKTANGENTLTTNSNLSENGSSILTGGNTSTDINKRRNLDTPQGSFELTDEYLTNATQEDNSNNSTNSSNGSSNSTSTGSATNHNTNDRTETFTKDIESNVGIVTTEMLQKHIELQKTLQNLEQKFFDECNDLFMLIY